MKKTKSEVINKEDNNKEEQIKIINNEEDKKNNNIKTINSEENRKDNSKETNLKKIMRLVPNLIIVFALILPLFWGTNLLAREWINSLINMFGNQVISMIIITFATAIVLGIIYVVLMRFIQTKFGGTFNIWFQLTIILGVILLCSGTIAINNIVEVPNLDSSLLNKEGKEVGSLDCFDSTGQFAIGNTIVCNVKEPKLKTYNATVTFQLWDLNNTEPLKKVNEINFIARNSRAIFFEIKGITETNEEIYLRAINEFRFPSINEVMENNNKRAGYIIALLGVILFSVPSAMVNLKELYKNKKENK